MAKKHCLIKDCDYPVNARSLCSMHYWRWYSGQLEVELPPPMSKGQAGAIGGKVKNPLKGFGSNPALAREVGVYGGRKRKINK